MTRARDVANVLTAANVLSTDIESAAAISAHTGITDPHPAYLQESTFSANQIVYKNASNEATGSANLTFSGSDLAVAGTIRSTASAGDEGGEIFLNKSATNTTLTGGVVLDVNQNRLRIFEEGGSNRGYYLDMASGGTGVGTNLGSSGGMTLLATATLNSLTTSITSIPSTYKHLFIFCDGIQMGNGAATLRLYFNNDTTTTNYRYQALLASAGTLTGSAANAAIPTTQQNYSVTFSNGTLKPYFAFNVYRYTDTSGISLNGVSFAGGAFTTTVGSWIGGAAVNSIQVSAASLSPTAGTLYLYGVA